MTPHPDEIELVIANIEPDREKRKGLFWAMRLARALTRRPATTYQRCLAVHLHFAAPRGGLSE